MKYSCLKLLIHEIIKQEIESTNHHDDYKSLSDDEQNSLANRWNYDEYVEWLNLYNSLSSEDLKKKKNSRNC